MPLVTFYNTGGKYLDHNSVITVFIKQIHYKENIGVAATAAAKFTYLK